MQIQEQNQMHLSRICIYALQVACCRRCFSKPDRPTLGTASDSRECLMHAVLQGNYQEMQRDQSCSMCSAIIFYPLKSPLQRRGCEVCESCFRAEITLLSLNAPMRVFRLRVFKAFLSAFFFFFPSYFWSLKFVLMRFVMGHLKGSSSCLRQAGLGGLRVALPDAGR